MVLLLVVVLLMMAHGSKGHDPVLLLSLLLLLLVEMMKLLLSAGMMLSLIDHVREFQWSLALSLDASTRMLLLLETVVVHWGQGLMWRRGWGLMMMVDWGS